MWLLHDCKLARCENWSENLQIICSFGSDWNLQSKIYKPIKWMSSSIVNSHKFTFCDDFHTTSKVLSSQYITDILLNVSTGNWRRIWNVVWFKPNGLMCCKMLGHTWASKYRQLLNCTDEKLVCIKKKHIFLLHQISTCMSAINFDMETYNFVMSLYSPSLPVDGALSLQVMLKPAVGAVNFLLALCWLPYFSSRCRQYSYRKCSVA